MAVYGKSSRLYIYDPVVYIACMDRNIEVTFDLLAACLFTGSALQFPNSRAMKVIPAPLHQYIGCQQVIAAL